MIKPDEHTKKAIREMRRYHWKLSFCIFPHRCYLSGGWTGWFSRVMKGIRIISGPGEDILIKKFAIPQEYTFAKLRGDI